ncbi:MAG: SIMPL domain-containing protein [Oscillospiraceae bacterium]|nr:SIMPL domain-containing protein [Oscillospiraceae bacterium]
MRTITVKGVGTASTPPDLTVISLHIAEKAREYVDSVNGANERIEKLQKAIAAVGFAKEDLKTLSFNARTNYENYRDENGTYKQRFAGYACEYYLKLSMDFDNKRLSETLEAIANSGANAEQSIEFTVKEPEKVSARLLKAATENAREKAEVLCAASGVTLGELVNIDYNWRNITIHSASVYSEQFRGMDDGAPAAAMPEFEPDDIKSSDTATFVWEIK